MAVIFETDFSSSKANSYVSVAEADAYFDNHQDGATWTVLSPDAKKQALIRATADIDRHRFAGHKFRQNQTLEFPRINRRSFSGAFQSGRISLQLKQQVILSEPSSVPSSTKVIFPQLIETSDLPLFPTDFWKDGEVQIVSGVGAGQVRKVTESSPTNGEITVLTPFSPVPNTSSRLLLFGSIPSQIKSACFEQALFRASGDSDQAANRAARIAQGVKSIKVGNTSESYGSSSSVMSGEAMMFLKGLVVRYGRIT